MSCTRSSRTVSRRSTAQRLLACTVMIACAGQACSQGVPNTSSDSSQASAGFTRHAADEYYWLNDFVLTDVNADSLLDIAAANHDMRPRIRLNADRFGFNSPEPESAYTFRHVLPNLLPSADTPDMSKPGLYFYYEGLWGKIIGKGLGDYFGNLVLIGDSDDPFESFEVIDAKGDIRGQERSQIEGRKQLRIELGGDFELTLAPNGTRSTLFVSTIVPHKIEKRQIHLGSRRLETDSLQILFQGFMDHDWHNSVWSDFNGDGMPDVFIAQGGGGGSATHDNRVFNDLLLLSGPEPLLYDAAGASGIVKNGNAGRGAMIADIDQNGLPDIYVRNDREGTRPGKYTNLLHMQLAPLEFHEQAAQRHLDITTPGIGKWFDPDADGWPDMLWGDKSGVRLFRNTNGVFTEETICSDFTYTAWMSLGDFDNDGDIDAAVAAWPMSMVLVNNNGKLEPRPFTDFGLPPHCSGIQWVDYNNDGRMDLYAPPAGLYTQNADARFTKANLLATEKGWDPFAWGDLNNDGRMDLVRRTKAGSNANIPMTDIFGQSVKVRQVQPYTLTAFENTIANDNQWIELQLVGPKGNPQAIGATVLLENNGTRQLAQVGQFDSSQTSIGHYRIHFGLGAADERGDHPTLTVRWPDGTTQQIRNPAPNRLHIISQTDADMPTSP